MNSCWSIKKLIEICEKHFSGIWGKEAKKCGNAYVIRVSDIKEGGIIDYKNTPLRYIEPDKLKKFQLQEGDLLVVKSSGSKTRIISGRTAIFEKKDSKVFCPSNFLLTLRPNKNLVLPKWLWLYLNSKEAKEFVRKIIGATTYPNIRPVDYLNFEIPLPPLHIQKRIVARIEDLFEKIDKVKKLRQKTVEESEQFFFSVLAKILNRIKKKWSFHRIEKILIDFQNGFACSERTTKDKGIPQLRPNNISSNGTIDFSSLVFIPKELVNRNKYNLKKGDVLFNNTNSKELVGKAALVKDNLECVFSNHITRLRVDRKISVPKWLVINLNYLWRTGYFLQYSRKWIGQAGINIQMLKSIKIPLPPLSEQKKIVAYLDNLREKVEKLKKLQKEQLKDLEELKKSILEKAFKGELL